MCVERLIELRNAAQWTALPAEMIAALPATAYEDLVERIVMRDPRVVQERKE